MDREEGASTIMPYPKSEEALSKLTINLYARDVGRLKVRYGRWWAEEVRKIVRAHLGDLSPIEDIELEDNDV